MIKSKPSITKITELDRGTMKRVLNLSDVFAVGYGDLGSSIYYALGVTALFALGATPLALAIAGLIFACTALTYAEMSSMRLAAGGSSSFSRFAINDFISFIAGWVLLLDFIVTIAISAYSAVPYLAYFFPILKQTEPKIILTVLIIVSLFVLNYIGSKHSTRISWILTISTIVTQIIIILIAAFFVWNFPMLLDHFKIGLGNEWSPSWLNFMKGIAMAMVAYTGIESMAQLTSETKNPARTVPRAIVFVTILLVTMYFLISSVALSAVTPQVLSTTYLEDPIAGIVSALPFGDTFLGPWVGLLGSILLIVAANAGLIGASRVAFRMGEYHQLPRFLYKIHPTRKTPYVALAVFGVLASAIVIVGGGDLPFMADLYNFGASLAFATSHLSLLFLRVRQPNLERPFKISFSIPIGKGRSLPVTALFGLIATFFVWLSVMIFKPEGRYLGTAWLIIGIIMYFMYRKKENIDPIATLDIEKIQIPDYKELEFKKIVVATRGDLSSLQLALEIAQKNRAELIVTYVIEVPFSVSILTPMYFKIKEGELVLKEAEAVAREKSLKISPRLLRSRSTARAILDVAKEEEADLIILGGHLSSKGLFFNGKKETIDEVLKQAHCRVLVTYSPNEKSSS